MVRILDIGSGLTPDYRSTDAVDYQHRNSPSIKQNENFHIKGQIIPLGVSEKRIKFLKYYRDKNIKFRWGIDFNSGLPYQDDSFNRVVSHSSVMMFGRLSSYKEILRVLKHGGVAEIRSATGVSPTTINRVITLMKKAGFKKIKVSKNINDTRLFAHETNYFRNDCIYGYK